MVNVTTIENYRKSP